MTTQQRYQGSLIGLAVGDAVGVTVEFEKPGTFPPVTDMTGGGPFRVPLEPGQWTDDTSMALCLAGSLIACGGFDAADQMSRYVRWWKEGYLSSTGECFDIGNATSDALRLYRDTGEPFSGSTNPKSAGNGSLMRLAPAPLFFASDPELAIRMSGESSRTTHGAATCVDACRYFGGLLVGAVQGVDKDTLLSARYSPVSGLWERQPLCVEIDEIAAGSFRDAPRSEIIETDAGPRSKPPAGIIGSGYVVKSLEAALWAFYHSTDFRDGCLLAVNLGCDTDTTAAIYGQIAGAYYGVDGIPVEWRDRVAMGKFIAQLADELWDHGG
ncbi:MAG: ADP-ribosylglycohydrolase family protein [Chloroflexi bacterium]|nr:ADP-ribosylglycohydrolase family protein [Chloroflexota bacterium]MYD48253.1 ADP-ribosylglycohydrolase family protein [Chloroflexota bacterium]